MRSSQHQKHFVLVHGACHGAWCWYKLKPLLEAAGHKVTSLDLLVHGACHGAWCWYKLKPLLEAAGHKVTSLDLSASGINSTQITDIRTFNDYNSPLLRLLDSIPCDDKVILAGHSLGGLNIALAMDKFSEKILAGIFLTAFMPDTDHAPSYVLEKYKERIPAGSFLDTQFYPNQGENPFTVMFFGTRFLPDKLYQCCSAQDLEPAKTLVRPSSMFVENLSETVKFTEEGYGSVKRVYIVCGQDIAISEEFQRWIIENGGATEVMEIKKAGHMAMLSRPQEVCQWLLNVASNEYN